MLAFEDIAMSLTRDQDKLIQMGTYKIFKTTSFACKRREGFWWQREEKEYPQQSTKKPKCAYCKKLRHEEHQCDSKHIGDLKKKILMKNQIKLSSTMLGGSSYTQSEKKRGNALVEVADSKSGRWILDS